MEASLTPIVTGQGHLSRRRAARYPILIGGSRRLGNIAVGCYGRGMQEVHGRRIRSTPPTRQDAALGGPSTHSNRTGEELITYHLLTTTGAEARHRRVGIAVRSRERIVGSMAKLDETAPLSEGEPEVDILAELRASRPLHPALGRLHDRLVGASSEHEITSYDRMHHRHNRK